MDAAASVAKNLPKGTGLGVAVMVVDSVRDDDTVNLAQGDAVHQGVPCLTSYLDRQAGDQVLVLQAGAGWCVYGKVGAPWSPPAAVIPPIPTVSWGEAAPTGTGWVTGTPWVRSGELYIQTSAGSGSSPAPTPGPVTLSPTSQGAWRDGSRDGGQPPTQGAWPAYPHPYTGAWFYGDTLVDACAGKSAASATIKLARTSAQHGSYGRVQPRLHLISAGSGGTSTPALNSPSSPLLGPGLGLGSSRSFTLPSSWRDALASGSAKGVGVEAGVGSDYLIFTGSCGQITFTFS